MGEQAHACPLGFQLPQAVRGSVGWQVLRAGREAELCAPRALAYPATGFPREPQPHSSPPWCCY